MAGWPLGISGKIIFIILDSFLLTSVKRPEDSAIWVIPSHKHIRGNIVNIMSIPLVPLVRRVLVRLVSLFMML